MKKLDRFWWYFFVFMLGVAAGYAWCWNALLG